MSDYFGKVRSFVLRQYDATGMWLGAMQSQFNNVQSYVSMVQFLLVVAVAYHTTLRDTVLQYLPWMNFWLFFLLGVALYLLVMLVDYKVVVPSRINYSNYQAYKHYNPVKEDLKEIQADMRAVARQLKVLIALLEEKGVKSGQKGD